MTSRSSVPALVARVAGTVILTAVAAFAAFVFWVDAAVYGGWLRQLLAAGLLGGSLTVAASLLGNRPWLAVTAWMLGLASFPLVSFGLTLLVL